MRRNPLVVLAAIVSVYIYLLVREAGHLAAMLLAGVSIETVIRYGVIPAFEIGRVSHAVGPITQGLIMVAAPVMALLVGYFLFGLVIGHSDLARTRLGPTLVALCYVALIFDPIYYSVIPLARLGGEPERMAYLFGTSTEVIAGCGFALLVLNIVLIRVKLIPLVRNR